MQIGLAGPLHVVHQVRLVHRVGDCRAEDELVVQRRREVVAFDRLQVDLTAAQLGISRVERPKIALRG